MAAKNGNNTPKNGNGNNTPKNGSGNAKTSKNDTNTQKKGTGTNTQKSGSAPQEAKKTGTNAQKKKMQKKEKQIIIRALVLIGLAVILGISCIWEKQINRALNLRTVESAEYDGDSTNTVIAGAAATDSSLTIHFVDVGQGDACIIELPDDKKMIIDGGKDKEKGKLLTYIDEVIDPNDEMLESKKDGGYGFDYAILTHSDEDHCGGLDDVINQYGARVFYRPNEAATYNGYADPGKRDLLGNHTEKNTLAYKRVIEAGYTGEAAYVTNANDDETSVIKPDGIDENDPNYYELNFYTPIKNSYKDFNDYSPVMILSYQGKKIALSGDAEKEAEAEFVAAAQAGEGKYSVFTDEYTVDVIKLGHHGSRTSSSQEYLETITTDSYCKNVLAIVSCGFGNSYGHPHDETITRLGEMGFRNGNILRTDTNGTIVLAVRYDEEIGGFGLFHGATAVRVEKSAMNIGTLEIEWRELCITVWLALAIVLIVQPIVSEYNKKTKKSGTRGKKK